MSIYLLAAPPVAFALFLLAFALLMKGARRYAVKGEANERELEPYACGQREFESYVNPDYMAFFRYAFVFSVLHVLALMVATAPTDALALPLAYVAAGILTLSIIFRK